MVKPGSRLLHVQLIEDRNVTSRMIGSYAKPALRTIPSWSTGNEPREMLT